MKKEVVGFTASTFDLLHAGHIAMLREPVQTLVERYIQLSAVSYVDEIIPYQTEQDLEDILNTFQIDVRVIGEEYKHGTFTGRAICAKRGIEIYFNKREHRFSTSDLRKRVNNA
jgi:glycerol-3-phosphate cytidylyltransferase